MPLHVIISYSIHTLAYLSFIGSKSNTRAIVGLGKINFSGDTSPGSSLDKIQLVCVLCCPESHVCEVSTNGTVCALDAPDFGLRGSARRGDEPQAKPGISLAMSAIFGRRSPHLCSGSIQLPPSRRTLRAGDIL